MFVAARRLLLLAAGRSRLCVRARGICRVAKRDRRFASCLLASLVGTAIRLRGNLRRTYSAAFEAVSIVLWARLLVAWCRAIDNVLRWSGFGLGGLRNRRGDLLGRAGRRRLHAARGLCSTRVRWPGNGHRCLWFSRLQRIRFGRLVHGGGWPTRGVEDRPMAWPAQECLQLRHCR